MSGHWSRVTCRIDARMVHNGDADDLYCLYKSERGTVQRGSLRTETIDRPKFGSASANAVGLLT